MLNKSGENEYSCLVPNLKGNAFSFSCLNMILAVGLPYIYYVEVSSLCAHFLESFYHKCMLNFIKSFSCIGWDDHKVFTLQFVNVVNHTDRSVDTEKSLNPCDKSHLIIICDPFTALLDSVCQYFAEDFCICVHQWFVVVIQLLSCV